ncbi:hypothetical protein CFOL_v3_11256, partial [Cephalotus follicularis]
YIGIPLISSKLGYNECRMLADKLMSRISSWTSKYLSFGGRLQLNSSTLFGFKIYWRFLLYCREEAKKAGMISWTKVCTPKQEEGLGIKSISGWNRAATLQYGWEICTSKQSVWVQ